MTNSSLLFDAIEFGLEIGKGIIVHAKGNPAQIVAVGAAAAIAAVAAGAGYAIYKAGALMYDKMAS